jgi:hypothetical protein
MKPTTEHARGSISPYRVIQRLIIRSRFVSGDKLASAIEADPDFRCPDIVRDYLCGFLRGHITERRGPKRNIARDQNIAQLFEHYLPMVKKRKKKGTLGKFKHLSPDAHNESPREIAVTLALLRLGIAMSPERGLKIVQGQKRRRNNAPDFVWRKTDNGVSETKTETINERPGKTAKGRVPKPRGS